MPITPKSRKDLPDPEATIFNAAAAAEIETRTTGYADTLVTELGAAVEAAMQPKDADLTAIAALETKLFGRELLTKATAVAVREALALGSAALQSSSAFAASIHASQHQLGGIDPLALPQYDPSDSLPGHITDVPGTTLTPTVKRLYLARYTVPKKREVKFMRFGVNAVGSAEDKVDAGVYKWVSGNKLERIASSGVKTLPTNSLGSKVTELTATTTLEPGTIYYRGFGFETVTGSLAILATLNNQGAVGDIFYGGSASTPHPSRLYMFKEASVPLPAEITSLAGSTPCLWTVPSES